MSSRDIEKFIEGGQTLTESIQTYITLKENPANSVQAAEAMLSMAGLTIGLVGGLCNGEVAKVLSIATGLKVGALGVVASSIQLGFAIRDYNNLPDSTDTATKNAALAMEYGVHV